MKREMLKWLRQILTENDDVERNAIKRKVFSNFTKLRFVMNDREAEAKFKEHLKLSVTLFCKDCCERNRETLLDDLLRFEKLFV